MIDLSVVIVSWNVRDLLQRCLESIHASVASSSCADPGDPSPKFEIIVVDNASDDASVRMVGSRFPDARVVINQTNRGFPAANNQGITLSRGRYVLLLNPDTEVMDSALSQLITFADRHPTVGIVGPQLLNPDGSVQPSIRRFPTLKTAFIESTWLQPMVVSLQSKGVARVLSAPIHRMLDRYYMADRSEDIVQDVDWITGAAMFTRREAIDDVGLMDEGFFMYSEELDWCRRFQEEGWRIAYLPGAQIVHHVGKSSEQVVAARHIHFQTSKVRYFRKYHGIGAAEVLRWRLMAGYLCQLALESAKWLLGHRRRLRAQRIAAYRKVLATRLLSRGGG